MLYNKHIGTFPILKARFLYGAFTGGYAPFTYTGCNAESMKGGMLMKSKHCCYGKKIAFRNFRNYHFLDDFFHKSKMTALAKVRSF